MLRKFRLWFATDEAIDFFFIFLVDDLHGDWMRLKFSDLASVSTEESII